MGLAETLGARAARQGRSAPVECGELGILTVEALPVRELELLLRGPDGVRAVFYAACRELQSAGEELRRAGKVFAPDGIMQFVSDSEAAAAARTVLELSGQAAQNNVDPTLHRASDVCANRLSFVQEKAGSYEEKTAENMGENRLAPVQSDGVSGAGSGQVSRETGADLEPVGTNTDPDRKAQAMGILSPERTQNVENLGYSLEAAPKHLHETESEFKGVLHEAKSEFQGEKRDTMHETTSEFREALHEAESEFGEIRRGSPHESKSESGDTAHEAELKFRDGLHEMTSEFAPKDRAVLHETTSELAENVARRLVEGLRRAKWVRGGLIF